jgi:hypothetical protein
MAAESQAVLFPGPWSVLPGLVFIGVGVYLARSDRYRRWARSLNPEVADKVRNGYLAIPLTIVFFGVLGVVAGLAALLSGR